MTVNRIKINPRCPILLIESLFFLMFWNLLLDLLLIPRTSLLGIISKDAELYKYISPATFQNMLSH